MNENTINTGAHYHKIIITENLVGETLDPALIASLYDLDPLLLQALKKILMAGKRGLKNREDDLIGAMSSINRQLAIDKLELNNKGEDSKKNKDEKVLESGNNKEYEKVNLKLNYFMEDVGQLLDSIFLDM